MTYEHVDSHWLRILWEQAAADISSRLSFRNRFRRRYGMFLARLAEQAVYCALRHSPTTREVSACALAKDQESCSGKSALRSATTNPNCERGLWASW